MNMSARQGTEKFAWKGTLLQNRKQDILISFCVGCFYFLRLFMGRMRTIAPWLKRAQLGSDAIPAWDSDKR